MLSQYSYPGKQELPEILPKPKGKRGKMVRSDAHTFFEEIEKHKTVIFTLCQRRGHVTFTNNRAERDLRMTKVKQKISGCFRKQQYAHEYCLLYSYLQTLVTQGGNLLVATQIALAQQNMTLDHNGGE